MSYPVCYTRKVRYSDTDEQGHVFNANYFVYFDDAITDYMEAALGSTGGQPGYEIVLARVECDFRQSAKLGETLDTFVKVERIGNTSMTFHLETKRDGKVVASGREIYVAVDAKTMKPIPVPQSLKDAIAKLE